MSGTESFRPRPEQGNQDNPPVQAPQPPRPGLRSAKIQGQHLERLAVVYIRQSSPQQVLEHRESNLRQYGLVDYAVALGWPAERVLVIDEDQGQSGQSAATRLGFQRLLTEVTLDHVGLILGLEMSRLARSNKDWHQLLELCGIFGTLLADQDGVYDAQDPNDRLLLGLKGTMSELELQTMRNRLEKGKLNKAARGELFLEVPVGYVKTPSGGLALDPDEQVRAVVTLLFEKFEELGSVRAVFSSLLQHGIRLGIRCHDGPQRGQLEWRRPCLPTLYRIFHHPFYAGTYAYGRSPIDPKRQSAQRRRKARKSVPLDQWKAVRHDHVPAYITWERYLRNQEKLRQNCSCWETTGVPRPGAALLGGLVICGRCGSRMQVRYTGSQPGRYDCVRHLRQGRERTCQGLSASVLDPLVVQQLLQALEPAALELSLRACEDIERERQRLAHHWQQQRERARYESHQAERHYRAVDPENRLVARTLEQQWEQALRNQRQQEEEYDRYLRQTPVALTAAEQDRIRSLAADIPALWESSPTTVLERKEILRCLIERVVVSIQGNTEEVEVSIAWAGGFASQHRLVRPVAEYRQMRDYDRLVQRLRALREQGDRAAAIADQLNEEGFHPTGRRQTFSAETVRQLLCRWGLSGDRREQVTLDRDEWWLSDLARHLQTSLSTVRRWFHLGWVQGRQSPQQGYYILWADGEEVDRLCRLRDYGKTYPKTGYPAALTTPKPQAGASGQRKKGATAHQRPQAQQQRDKV